MSDTVPITRLDELEKHLDLLNEAPETPLDIQLLDDVELQLNEYNSPPLLPKLLPKLISILFSLQQDPLSVVSLSIKLIRPISFTDILTFTNEDALILALQSPSPAPVRLALSVIVKATKSSTNAAMLSVMKNLVTQLVSTWLSNPDVGIGDLAGKIIGEGLVVDCSNPLPILDLDGRGGWSTLPVGQGLLWRRIFLDGDIMALILDLCRPSSPTLDARQKSLAQSRLASLLPRIARFNTTIFNHPPRFGESTEESLRNGNPNPNDSGPANQLLRFVAYEMIDPETEDVLMRTVRYQFWIDLIVCMSQVHQLSDFVTSRLRDLVDEGIKKDPNLKPFLKSHISTWYVGDWEPAMQLIAKMNLGLDADMDD